VTRVSAQRGRACCAYSLVRVHQRRSDVLEAAARHRSLSWCARVDRVWGWGATGQSVGVGGEGGKEEAGGLTKVQEGGIWRGSLAGGRRAGYAFSANFTQTLECMRCVCTCRVLNAPCCGGPQCSQQIALCPRLAAFSLHLHHLSFLLWGGRGLVGEARGGSERAHTPARARERAGQQVYVRMQVQSVSVSTGVRACECVRVNKHRRWPYRCRRHATNEYVSLTPLY